MGGRYTRLTVGTSRRDRSQRRRTRGAILTAVLVVGGLASLFAVRGVQIVHLRRAILDADAAYEQAMIERADLEARLALKDTLSAIEQAAREQLGWVMPGEIRVIFYDPADGAPDGEG